MIIPVHIFKQLRVVFTAITLLCVVALNNREVTTYTAAQTAPAHQVDKSAAAQQHGTIKQKVSLEGTASYLILQLAALPGILPELDFPQPFAFIITFYQRAFSVAGFFKIFFSAAIQPNAP